MEKVRKQIIINIVLVVASVLVIVLAKCYNADSFLGWRYWLGSDIVFVMITSLATMVGWRVVENIRGFFSYNILVGLLIMCFCMEYGAAIANCNDFLLDCICASLVLFLFFYFVENIIVIAYFKRQLKNRSKNKLGYSREEEG